MSSKPDAPSYSRHRIASVFIGFGILVLLSGLVVNPWTGRLYRSEVIVYYDVMRSYFLSAVSLSILLFGCALLLRFFLPKWIEGVSMLLLIVSIVVLSDRLLLARNGLPLWVADAQNHFKHRPGAVRSWGSHFDNKLIRINNYGHHDDDFPIEKGNNEFRAVMVGDSITMGHGVTREETFSNQLENDLNQTYGSRRSFQVINAGVQGYATFQEYNVLVDSFRFKPDFVTIQFCLNDLTDPFVVEKRFGGTGFHYDAVAEETSGIATYFLNETGYGRLIEGFRNKGRSVETERRMEIYKAEKAAASEMDDPVFSPAWETTLSNLEKIYAAARLQDVKVLLLICPHTFQMIDDDLRHPQQILSDHARSKGVDVIDLTTVFDKLIYDKEVLETLNENNFTPEEIEKLYENRTKKYFLDQDHYTAEGHRIVANELFEYLKANYSL
jgi:lysophospholipase L1-like esterase